MALSAASGNKQTKKKTAPALWTALFVIIMLYRALCMRHMP